ncbi:microsomal dipeptidase-like Zn-dependent dipeptidase [Streptomyces sp. HB132]|nr:microsomal dipeptidase-like Zn-dependent dipeptidase [Streptomyces sp. HB132]
MHRLGVRIASIAHLGRTQLADGSAEDAAGSRLTAAGVEALAEMERLGVLFDVSHLGAAGVAHVLEIATRPVLATHSGARALCDHHRNLTDDQLRAIAATGGTVCVNFYPEFLSADPAERTVDRVVDHILHIADVIGIDRVGLGPDFIKEVDQDLVRRCCEGPADADELALPGLEGPGGLPLITRSLTERGVPEDAVLKILGRNLLDLLRANLGRSG